MTTLGTAARAVVRDGLRSVDRQLASASSRFERPALISLLFHAVLERPEQFDDGVVLPQERLTHEHLAALIEYFQASDHTFVSPAEISAGLPGGGRYALLTFDDGYANNLTMLDVLRRYRVPATIAIASAHVERGKAFWWDVIHRERHRRGGEAGVEREVLSIFQRSPAEIERYVLQAFGPGALTPEGDLDRPMTPEELARLAAEPLITIGNHTAEHGSLLALTAQDAEEQLLRAQRYLERMTGVAPTFVSYPHGVFDDGAVNAARRCGCSLGITIEARKDRLPLEPEQMMRLGRFSVVCDRRFMRELRLTRSDVRLERLVRRLVGR